MKNEIERKPNRQERKHPQSEKYTTPFQTIPQASKTTGLSKYFLREGCKNGTVPHIMSGNVFYINVPVLLEQLGVKDWF